MNNPEASRPSLCQASLAVAKVVTVAAVETVEVGEDQVVTSCLVVRGARGAQGGGRWGPKGERGVVGEREELEEELEEELGEVLEEMLEVELEEELWNPTGEWGLHLLLCLR